MEEVLIALAALLGSSLTAAYVTNSWQKSKSAADALDDCAEGVFRQLGLLRLNLGKVWGILHTHTTLGKVWDFQKTKMEQCTEAAFEASAALDTERWRLLTLDPRQEDALKRLMDAVASAMKPISSVYFSPFDSSDINNGITIQIPGGSTASALKELDESHRKLTLVVATFAVAIGDARKSILSQSWRVKPKWIVSVLMVILVLIAGYAQFGAYEVVLSGEDVYRYNRLSGTLERLQPMRSEPVPARADFDAIKEERKRFAVSDTVRVRGE